MSAPGTVYLVGAGPGDPGLITVRGRACLERADSVLYDALANPLLLEYAPATAERVFVGKTRGHHTVVQDEINRLLLEHAQRHRRVVRLKGGDPFVFGRGGEEALFLAEHSVPFEVVPGVTAGIAAPAYAGIPITHRGLSTSFTLVTGHLAEDGAGLAADLDRIAQRGTLAFYMGLKTLPLLVGELRRLGRASDTPAAVIEWGSTPRQRCVTATLEALPARCAEAGLQPPALVLVGDVVGLREQLNWFEQRPLFGLRIVVTRAAAQAGEFVATLQNEAADVLLFPTIQTEANTEAVLPSPAEFDWVVFTSVNAVDAAFTRLFVQGLDARAFGAAKLCAVGPAVAASLEAHGLRADLMPGRHSAEGLLDALRGHESNLRDKRFLFPKADIAKETLPTGLRGLGAEVVEVDVYRTTCPETSPETIGALLRFMPQVVTFMSPSAAQNFAAILGPQRLAEIARHAVFASIGPTTSYAIEKLGLEVEIEATTFTSTGLLEAVMEWAARSPRAQ